MRTLLTAICLISFVALSAQDSWWATALSTGQYGSLRMNVQLQPIGIYWTGTSTPNAHKRIVGGLKATFAKSMFAAEGSLIALDSLRLENGQVTGYLILEKRRYLLSGTASEGSIRARLLGKTTGKVYGELEMNKVATPEKPNDYPALWQQIKALTEKNIYNRAVLSQKPWLSFCKEMDQFAAVAEDDAEFAYGFFYRAGSLPFSHYVVEGSKAATAAFALPGYGAAETDIRPSLRWLNGQTLLLDVPAFNFRKADIDSLMHVVTSSNARNLVIDLRQNTGGDMEGGLQISRYLIGEKLYGGVMLSQVYWNQHTQPPLPADYVRFRPMNGETYAWFRQQVASGIEGLCLVAEPAESRYKGRVFLLTSGATASASEPFVYALQHAGIATVVGEKTAGAVISMEYFSVGSLSVTIPMLDYYTADGKRLDRVGVQPDVRCTASEALNRVLALVEGR